MFYFHSDDVLFHCRILDNCSANKNSLRWKGMACVVVKNIGIKMIMILIFLCRCYCVSGSIQILLSKLKTDCDTYKKCVLVPTALTPMHSVFPNKRYVNLRGYFPPDLKRLKALQLIFSLEKWKQKLLFKRVQMYSQHSYILMYF